MELFETWEKGRMIREKSFKEKKWKEKVLFYIKAMKNR